MKYHLKLEPAFVIHRRPYRDTSLLIDFFTPRYGLLTAVARGVRNSKSVLRGILHPFIPLLITGRGQNLLTLFQAETQGQMSYLVGNILMAGLYLNELLMRLLVRHDPHPQLFQAYQTAILQLTQGENLAITSRFFEMQLLKELGYGLQFDKTSDGQCINPAQFYSYQFGIGFYCLQNHPVQTLLFPGHHLQAIHNAQFELPAVQLSAKRLFQVIIRHLLSNQSIN